MKVSLVYRLAIRIPEPMRSVFQTLDTIFSIDFDIIGTTCWLVTDPVQRAVTKFFYYIYLAAGLYFSFGTYLSKNIGFFCDGIKLFESDFLLR